MILCKYNVRCCFYCGAKIIRRELEDLDVQYADHNINSFRPKVSKTQ